MCHWVIFASRAVDAIWRIPITIPAIYIALNYFYFWEKYCGLAICSKLSCWTNTIAKFIENFRICAHKTMIHTSSIATQACGITLFALFVIFIPVIPFCGGIYFVCEKKLPSESVWVWHEQVELTESNTALALQSVQLFLAPPLQFIQVLWHARTLPPG